MITLRAGTDSDRPRILAGLEEVFGPEPAQHSDRLWHWQWHLDPRLAQPGYRGIIAEWEGRIIGNIAMIPAGLFIQGQPVACNWCVDTFVHWGLTRSAMRQARRNKEDIGLGGKGLARAMLDRSHEDGIQLGKPIAAQMRTIALRIGFENRPESGSMHRRVSVRHALSRAIGAAPSALITPIIDLALPRIRRPQLPITPLDGPFDARFDSLWMPAAAELPLEGGSKVASERGVQAVAILSNVYLGDVRLQPLLARVGGNDLLLGLGALSDGYLILEPEAGRARWVRIVSGLATALHRSGESDEARLLIETSRERARSANWRTEAARLKRLVWL